jgi:A/G-specific adenine glycosylase
MALWSGLGYYSRARNLHRCAVAVMAQHGGEFPASAEALAELPGIGRSTAAAIAAFAFGTRATILDGNVKRVLARAFGVEGFPGEKRVENQLWTLAESLLPPPASPDLGPYTQGLMDLGATLCVSGKPDCARCPFQADCAARLAGRQAELPTRRPKKAVPTRSALLLIVRSGGAVLLEKRPPTGIWGGLWSLPQAADDIELAARLEALGYGGRLHELAPLLPMTHVFTHFRLEIAPRLLDAGVPARAAGVADDSTAWVPLADVDAYGLPAPVRRLLGALQGTLL